MTTHSGTDAEPHAPWGHSAAHADSYRPPHAGANQRAHAVTYASANPRAHPEAHPAAHTCANLDSNRGEKQIHVFLHWSHLTVSLNPTRPPLLNDQVPTFSPTAAPTRACGAGEYRPPTGGPCAFCAPGTFWNLTTETNSCLACPDGQTSLQGATSCYSPCPPNTALNTTDLTCVPIPASINDLAANSDLNLTQSDVYVITESGALEGTIGAAAGNTNTSTETIVIALGPNLYPQQGTYTITTNVVIVNDPTQGSATGSSRARHLQTYVNNSVIVAPPNTRHFTIVGAGLFTDGVTFMGSSNGVSSGGVELDGANGLGVFANTVFQNCRATGNGGGLLLTNGAWATLSSGSEMRDNRAAQGGAVYADTGSVVTLNR